ncbi:MAG: hypothetical protein AAF968_24785 [Pseudomonadota bacterium]
MFERARELVLSDRVKARRALTDELKRLEREELDAELDQLEAEELQLRAERTADAERAEREKELRARLAEVRLEQHAAATAFDAAVLAANGAFEDLERLADETVALEREVGGDGRRPVIAGQARTTALVSAMWNSARPLSKRLRLGAVPGGPHKVRPLTSRYPEIEEEGE